MQLTVLVDNNTLIDRYFLGEPGVSYLIREGSRQVLFDVGYSDAFIINARKMNLDVLQSDFVVLSHGHLDHTGGLEPLRKLHEEAHAASVSMKRPKLIAHPDAFLPKSIEGARDIGCTISPSRLRAHFDVHLTAEPLWLTERLVFLGEIERTHDFENREPVGEVHTGQGPTPDFMWDDTALAYRGEGGLVIITGCSHCGICNIVDYAKKVCGQDKIIDVIGGFHLLKPNPCQLDGTLEYVEKLRPGRLHACHCVDLDSKIALSKVSDLKEVGVGLSLEYA